jgi:hypothetical protein
MNTGYYDKCMSHVQDHVFYVPVMSHSFSVVSDIGNVKGGYTLDTLPLSVTPYRDSVDRTRDHGTYQKLVTQ